MRASDLPFGTWYLGERFVEMNPAAATEIRTAVTALNLLAELEGEAVKTAVEHGAEKLWKMLSGPAVGGHNVAKAPGC